MSGTIAFPPNPTVGQTYTFGGSTWVWNGTVWTNATQAGAFLPLAGGTMTGPAVLKGVVDGSNAPVGAVGEFLTASNTAGFGMTNSTVGDIVALALTAGDWDLWGWCQFQTAGANAITNMIGSISTTSNTLGPYPSQFSTPDALGGGSFPLTQMRVSLSATETYVMTGYVAFSAGSVTGYGSLFARRVR